MSFYLNYTFKSSGVNLTGVADFTAAAVGTVFEKKSGELFTKNTQGLFEKTARVIPSLADLNAAVTGHETNLAFHKQNINTTTDPLPTSDSSAGYSVGSVWINTSTNTAFTCTDSTVGAAQWTSGYVPAATTASIPLSQKGVAGGVATLDSGGNLVKGLSALNGKNVMLATNTDLGALPLTLSSGFYDVQYTAAGTVASRRGLPLGWYHLEIQRHSGDVSGNRYYTVRATPLNTAGTDIWTLNVQAGVVTNFTKQTAVAQARADAAYTLASNLGTFVTSTNATSTDKTGIRAVGVTYTAAANTIKYVHILPSYGSAGQNQTFRAYIVDSSTGSTVYKAVSRADTAQQSTNYIIQTSLSFIVPAGLSYRVDVSAVGGNSAIFSWYETDINV